MTLGGERAEVVPLGVYNMPEFCVKEVDGGVVFAAKIVPGSSRTCSCGLLDGMLKVKVSAPPEKGKANRCLIGFLGKQLGVKNNAVSIVSGLSNPVKRVQVVGVTVEGLLEKLDLRK